MRGLAKRSYGECTRSGVNLRETHPLPHPVCGGSEQTQRSLLTPGVAGHQGMLWSVTGQVHLGYPALRSGFRSERLGLQANRHLERPQRVHLRERGRATTGCQGERGESHAALETGLLSTDARRPNSLYRGSQCGHSSRRESRPVHGT
jgi:hypothetical protein